MLLSTVILFLDGKFLDNSSSSSAEAQAICLFFELWHTIIALLDRPVMVTSIVSVFGIESTRT